MTNQQLKTLFRNQQVIMNALRVMLMPAQNGRAILLLNLADAERQTQIELNDLKKVHGS